MFERVGSIQYAATVADADTMFEEALEAGAADVASDDDGHEVTCAPDDFAAVRDALSVKFGDPVEAGFDWKPNTTTELDEQSAGTMLKLIDVLEDNEDVQKVFSNFEVSDEILAKLSE